MKEIKFNIDIKYAQHDWNRPWELDKKTPQNYITFFRFLLPLENIDIFPGVYKFEDYEINIKWIYSKQEDPLWEVLQNDTFGPVIETAKEPLRFKDFSDNHEVYPACLISVIIPRLVNNGLKAEDSVGAKNLNEEIEITGEMPNDLDKIEVLKIINRFFKSEIYPKNVRVITYEDITVTRQDYYYLDKTYLCTSTKYLNSKYALRNAAYYSYLGPNWKKIIEEIPETKSCKISTEYELCEKILELVGSIKSQVEKRRWTEAFWHKGKEGGRYELIPKKEPEFQHTLEVLFLLMLDKTGILVQREVDEGVGKLDFCFTYTTESLVILTVCMEMKIAHNGRIEHGLETQLPLYMDATNSEKAIYLVFWFKDEKNKYFNKPKNVDKEELTQLLEGIAKEIKKDKKKIIHVEIIDASIKASASKQ